MSVTLAISTMFSVSHQFLNHYLTHIITVVAFKHKTATWCFSSVCVRVLHMVSFLLYRYDDDHIAGGDKERYAR